MVAHAENDNGEGLASIFACPAYHRKTSSSRDWEKKNEVASILFTVAQLQCHEDPELSEQFIVACVAHNLHEQSLTKLRFLRNVFSETEKENFKRLVEGNNFYKIRLPSNVLRAPGRKYIVSSVKAVSVK